MYLELGLKEEKENRLSGQVKNDFLCIREKYESEAEFMSLSNNNTFRVF